MNEHTINVPVLRKALEHVTARQDEWNQADWARQTSCGTAYCLAGTVAIQQGYEIAWTGTGLADDVVGGRTIEDVAAEAIGLTIREHYDHEYGTYGLFKPWYSLDELWHIANRITNGEIEIPAYMGVK